MCHPDLQTFLETNLPKSSKKEKILLGVSDSKLAAAIVEANGAACMHTGIVPEIIRGKLTPDIECCEIVLKILRLSLSVYLIEVDLCFLNLRSLRGIVGFLPFDALILLIG